MGSDTVTLQTYPDLIQGSDEWLAARCGLLTASTIGKLITPKLEVANNETSRGLTATLVAERITGYSDPMFVTADMARGNSDEPIARDHYSEHKAVAAQYGFMVLMGPGYNIGYSPDGVVGSAGLIEIKSRKPKIHLTTILTNTVPAENMAQIQCGLMVSGRDWCDYVSWCGGLPMWVIRVHPDVAWFKALTFAAQIFEDNADHWTTDYTLATSGLPATERIDHFQEMTF